MNIRIRINIRLYAAVDPPNSAIKAGIDPPEQNSASCTVVAVMLSCHWCQLHQLMDVLLAFLCRLLVITFSYRSAIVRIAHSVIYSSYKLAIDFVFSSHIQYENSTKWVYEYVREETKYKLQFLQTSSESKCFLKEDFYISFGTLHGEIIKKIR